MSEAAATPEPHALETSLIAALASLEIEAVPAEHSFKSAHVWAEFDSERPLFVHAYGLGTDGGEYSVVSERVVRDVGVATVRYTTGPIRDRFECDGVAYEVEGAAPPRFASADEFLAALIDVLSCPRS